ncbi:MAG: alpha/beta hydrolase [Propionibacteriaceae bacterium]|nr:alpha/beta hydrolase [Propionibacteriaceae bacterium]
MIIVIHGSSRNAPDHYRYIARAANLVGATDTLIVAPQFMTLDDVVKAGLSDDALYWSDGGWKEGDPSESAPLTRAGSISSFAVIDQFIAQVSDRSVFPNLADIVVVGHSAGGQFVHRYAAETRIEQTLASAGNRYRYVVANPSSYLYFDDTRYQADAFAPLTVAQRQACSQVNNYKYGLERLNGYGDAVGAAAIRAQYESRNVVFLLGADDTNPTDSSLDTSCGAQWQGPQRLARGTTFFAYLGHHFGSSIYQDQVARVVPNIGHDARDMYASADGTWALFGPLR